MTEDRAVEPPLPVDPEPPRTYDFPGRQHVLPKPKGPRPKPAPQPPSPALHRAAEDNVAASVPLPVDGLDVEWLAEAGGNVLDGRRIGSVRLLRNTITPDDWHAIAAEYARLSGTDSNDRSRE